MEDLLERRADRANRFIGSKKSPVAKTEKIKIVFEKQGLCEGGADELGSGGSLIIIRQLISQILPAPVTLVDPVFLIIIVTVFFDGNSISNINI